MQNIFLMFSPLSTGETALWHALMAVNNRLGWRKTFTTSNSTLQSMTGLSRQGIDRARNNLVKKGLIEYTIGKANKAGTYKMISFETQSIWIQAEEMSKNDFNNKEYEPMENDTIIEENNTTFKDETQNKEEITSKEYMPNNSSNKIYNDARPFTHNDTNQLPKSSHSSSTLYKLRQKIKTKNKNITTTTTTEDNCSCCSSSNMDKFNYLQDNYAISDIISSYEDARYNKPSHTQVNHIQQLLKDYSQEWVCEAFKTAAINSNFKLSYVDGILRNWSMKGQVCTSEKDKNYKRAIELARLLVNRF